jgi:formiminotetrahydrofolate cyclodeaminase
MDPLNQNTHELLYWAVRRGVAHAIWDIAAATKKLDIEDDFFDALKENINAGLKTLEGKSEEHQKKMEGEIVHILDQVSEVLSRLSTEETKPKGEE